MHTKNSENFVYLDLARGLAAVAVLVSHARVMTLDDWSGGSAIALSWYGLTAFGHQSVVIFFVLSGFFISRSIFSAHHRGNWSWAHYLTQRLTRLGIVLVPALILTSLLDLWGIGSEVAPELYAGTSGNPMISFNVLSHLSLPIGLANLFFLQKVITEPLGSNVALWSLAYEFWYYILFPCLWSGMQKTTKPSARVFQIAIAIAVLLLLNREGSYLFCVWLMGAACAWISEKHVLPPVNRWVSIGGWTLFLIVLALTVLKKFHGYEDIFLGFTFAPLVLLMSSRHVKPYSWAVGISKWLSETSYTLYAVHVPIVVFMAAFFLHGKRLGFAPNAVILHSMVVLIAIVSARCLWWLFERHTRRVQKWFLQRFAVVGLSQPLR
jgi:peptidoglycan/LPS O-acetylase OafA/YrhL